MRILPSAAAAVAAALLAAGSFAAAPAGAAPGTPVEDTRFATITGGNEFGAAVSTDGVLYTWGSNADGQLGRAGGDDPTPRPVTGFPNASGDPIVMFDANGGAGQSVALSDDGRVFAWGRASLGDGTTNASTKPVEVTTLSALRDSDKVVQVSAGDQHDLALTASGHVYAWGNGRRGALGTGDQQSVATPVDVTARIPLESGEKIVQVAAGFISSAVLTDRGNVYVWGGNVYGDLGDGTKTDRYTPFRLTIPGVAAGDKVVQLSEDSAHTLVLTESGAIFGWGANSVGAVGAGPSAVLSPQPIVLPGLASGDKAVQIATSQYSSLALTASGAVYGWGYNGWGQLGNGGSEYAVPTPVVAGDMPAVLSDRIVSIAASGEFSLALSDSGEVFSWGNNTSGQLGIGTVDDGRSVPGTIVLDTMSGTVTAEGQAYVGLRLTATPSTAAGDWHPAAVYTYQWQRDGVDIPGATSAEYTVDPADEGTALTVTITAQAPNWAGGSATSAPVTPVVGTPPTITSGQPAAVDAGAPFAHTVTATGDPAPTLTVTGLPDGLTFDASTGRITGSVAVAGTYHATVTATNGLSPDATQDLVIVVNAVQPVEPGGDGSGGAGSEPGGQPGAQPGGHRTPGLAATGLDLGGGALVATLVLLIAGGACVAVSRRRSAARS